MHSQAATGLTPSPGGPMATGNRRTIELRATICCPSLLDAPLPEDGARELARAFAAPGDPVRLRPLSLLAAAGEACSCDLEGPLGRSQPTVRNHTKAPPPAGTRSAQRCGGNERASTCRFRWSTYN